MESKRRRKALSSVRDVLAQYGCNNTESVRSAVVRLIDEHRSAMARAVQAEHEAEEALGDAVLASLTRDGAQALASDLHVEAQALRRENEQLRRELREMRKEVDMLDVDKARDLAMMIATRSEVVWVMKESMPSKLYDIFEAGIMVGKQRS